MEKRRAMQIMGGAAALGLGLAGLSWGQGRLGYLAAVTRPTVTPLPAVAGQPQRFILTFENGFTVNEVGRDGTVAETDNRVYPDTRNIRPESGGRGGPAREETDPNDARDRDGGRGSVNDRGNANDRDNGVDNGSDRGADSGDDAGADAGQDNGADSGTDNVTQNGRTLRQRAR